MWWLFLAITWTAVTASPLFQSTTPGSDPQNVTMEIQPTSSGDLNVDEYLRRYGYMNDVKEKSQGFEQYKRDAIKKFQRFVGIKVSGIVDKKTREEMLRARCGMKDIYIGKTFEGKWHKRVLTYKFANYPRSLNQWHTRIAVANAFDQWGRAANLTFIRVESGSSDMIFRFVEGSHPPCDIITDGIGGFSARGFFPFSSFRGEMHFDDAEIYTYKDIRHEYPTLDLQSLAMHEIGHSLGLTHENSHLSVMFPYYKKQLTLGKNDIKRIQRLYL